MFLSHIFLFDFYQIGYQIWLIAAQPGLPARLEYCTTGGLPSIQIQCAADQSSLIGAQSIGQQVQVEPLGASDLITPWNRDSFWGAAKDYLDLLVFLKCANECDARNLDLEADLFNQLAAQRLFGVFARTHKTAGNAPASPGTKPVMEQQDLLARINHYRAYSHGES